MECVGHVHKRLGKKLRDLKKKTFVDDNGQVLNLRWGGKGRLTNSVIDSLTVFYGGAIRNFPWNVDGMHRAIWAVFHHSLSNDEEHNHQFCPSGSDSWCKFNRTLANDEEPPKPNDVIDVTVTCDGTWSKRGFTALYGVSVVMSWDSGQVLDAVALSKQCTVCKQKESTMEEQEYLDWYAVARGGVLQCELLWLVTSDGG